MRLYAVRDYNNFQNNLPVKMKDADGKKLFKDLRTAMGIKSQKGLESSNETYNEFRRL